MGFGDFVKNKINDGKKSIIKGKAKEAIKEKIDIDNKYDSQIDAVLDKAIDKVGSDNIINAKKLYDSIKEKTS